LKNAELRASLAESQLRRSKDVGQHGRATSSVQNDAFTSHDSTTSYGSATLTADNNFAALPHSDVPLDATVWSNVQHSTGTASDWPRQPEQALSHELEQPPSGPEDFSWDEQSVGDELEDNKTGAADDAGSSGVTDGMASLSVDDSRAGYLGIASGAAMLRLLMPDAEHKHRRSAPRSQDHKGSVASNPGDSGWIPTPVWHDRRIYEIDVDAAINAYFSLYHVSYPIVCEPTFRAQYAQVIARPSGKSWNALAYIIAAIGLFTTSTEPVVRDLDLFEAAKANITIDSLETGNITLVQALALLSNYIQKRGKPNSGYNYLGIALHMAMGLGLHKEFQGWRIAPLQMEIRRRVWWALYNFYVGAAITFGRPLAMPSSGIECALPLNVDDRDLTHLSVNLPPPRTTLTTHSAIAGQARFHLMTNEIYAKVISLPFPTPQELLQMDDERISAWHSIWAVEASEVEPRYVLSRSIQAWRYMNLRIITFRPFVIRKVFQARMRHEDAQQLDHATETAVSRCLAEAKASIMSIDNYWNTGHRNCMASWYALYFLFQATMIPSVCLRNEPTSSTAQDWREQLNTALKIMRSMFAINPASRECHEVVLRLCSDYLTNPSGIPTSSPVFGLEPVEESPNTQIDALYGMMWPGVDMLVENDTWNNFIADLPEDSPSLLDHNFETFGPV
jgi:transcriptional regulatory protein GAL4